LPGQTDPEKQKKYIADYKQADIKKGFHLTRDPLLRFTLFKTNETSWVLIWSNHHIIMDGWCLSILFKDLVVIYRALLKNEIPPLEPAIPYKNYIDWLEKQDKEEGLAYWEAYLQGYEQRVGLPGQKPQLKSDRYRLEEYDFQLGEKETSLLNELAARAKKKHLF
jgi:fengycin family lipopeptide synthetase D